MSQNHDNLKSMFDQAFSNEQIPFDQGAWYQMSLLLNRRQRRRAIGIWVSGVLLFVIGSLSLAFVFPKNQEYEPRISDSDAQRIQETTIAPHAITEPMESFTPQAEATNKLIDEAQDVAPKTANNSDGSKLTESKNVIASNDAANQASVPTSNKSRSIVSAPNLTEKQIVKEAALPVATSTPSENIITENSIQTLATTAKVDDKASQKTTYKLMPILELNHLHELAQLEVHLEDLLPVKNTYSTMFYVFGGLTKMLGNSFTPYGGYGQKVGLGAMHQFREHLLLSAEIGGVRTRFSDTASVKRPITYGYTSIQNNYTINTTELMKVEIPILVHYRIKRFYLGTGLGIDYLIGLKNETIRNQETSAITVRQQESTGYYRWDRYNNLGLSALANFQLQVTDDLFIGLRGNVGLLNQLHVDYRTLRLSRLDAYIKFNIR
jgi:hypothetical protein